MRALRNAAITSSTRVPGDALCAFNAVRSPLDVSVHAVKRPLTWLLASVDSRHFSWNTDCSCTFSPRMVRTDTGASVSRCEMRGGDDARAAVASVHVVGDGAGSRTGDVPHALTLRAVAHGGVDRHAMDASATLTRGEMAYVAATRRVLTAALATGAEYFLVLEDDFLVHRDFNARFTRLTSHRCYREALAGGGVVLLGSTVWSEAAWTAMRPEMEASPCVDACRATTGSYANVYSREGALAALEWITLTGGIFPYDHVYPALVEAGYPVRAAWEPLFVADVSHVSAVNPGGARKSDVKYRHALHRWGPREDYATRLP